MSELVTSAPRLYIFDVDGTLRWTTVPGQKYPLRASEWRLMPNVAERLRAIPWSPSGPWLGVASNQNGVAEGLLDERLARAMIHDTLCAALGREPDEARIELCTCSESAACSCRKPAPGLLLRLLEFFAVQPEDAIFVGDLPIDEEAARGAGVAFRWAADFFGWRD